MSASTIQQNLARELTTSGSLIEDAQFIDNLAETTITAGATRRNEYFVTVAAPQEGDPLDDLIGGDRQSTTIEGGKLGKGPFQVTDSEQIQELHLSRDRGRGGRDLEDFSIAPFTALAREDRALFDDAIVFIDERSEHVPGLDISDRTQREAIFEVARDNKLRVLGVRPVEVGPQNRVYSAFLIDADSKEVYIQTFSIDNPDFNQGPQRVAIAAALPEVIAATRQRIDNPEARDLFTVRASPDGSSTVEYEQTPERPAFSLTIEPSVEFQAGRGIPADILSEQDAVTARQNISLSEYYKPGYETQFRQNHNHRVYPIQIGDLQDRGTDTFIRETEATLRELGLELRGVRQINRDKGIYLLLANDRDNKQAITAVPFVISGQVDDGTMRRQVLAALPDVAESLK